MEFFLAKDLESNLIQILEIKQQWKLLLLLLLLEMLWEGKILKDKGPNSHAVFLVSLQAADAPKFSSVSRMKRLSRAQHSSHALTWPFVLHHLVESRCVVCTASCHLLLLSVVFSKCHDWSGAVCFFKAERAAYGVQLIHHLALL